MYKVIDSSLDIQRLVENINKSLELFSQSALQQVVESAFPRQQLSQQLADLNRINFSIDIPKIYTALRVIDTSSLMRAFDVSSEIVKFTQSISGWQEAYSQQIAEIARNLDVISQRFTADLTAFRIAFQEIVSSGIINDLKLLQQESEDAAEAFKETGWPIAPSMPKQLKDRVVELHKNDRTRYASQTILGYYRRNNHRNLKLTIESWQSHPLFVPRMHIIHDALDAHCNGNYTLSIPALLPLIEGILNDYVCTNNLSAKFGKINQVYQAVIGNPDEYYFSTWAIVNTLLYQLQSNTYAYTSFESELTKSIRSRKTTRHTVLHGVAVNYDRPSNSLKLFLILDALTALRYEDEGEYAV